MPPLESDLSLIVPPSILTAMPIGIDVKAREVVAAHDDPVEAWAAIATLVHIGHVERIGDGTLRRLS